MMMDHHRFIKPSNTPNVLIGGAGSRSANSDSTDELTASDPATTDDFNYANAIDNSNFNNMNGRSSPTVQSSSLFGDDAFDKINMDFDSIMANNDLDTSNNLSTSYNTGGKGGIHSSDTSVNSEMLFDKLNAELGGTSELKGMGHSPGENSKGKLGDIGDELDMELLDALMPNEEDAGNPSTSGSNQAGEGVQQGSDSSMDQLLKSFPNAAGGNGPSSDDASIDKLLNIPLIDMEGHNPNNNNNSDSNNKKGDSNTANINLSLKKVDSTESLCDSMASLPSIGHISPNVSFANLNNSNMQTSMQQQMQQQQQQQQAMLMQQQQQLLLHQQMQQQQQQQNNSANNSSIQSIVNDQLSQLPQANELTKLGVAGLEHQKMKLIKRLQEIENTGVPMNVGQQQQQQQQQFLMQKQLFLQQQNQLQQQQQQQQHLQQQGIATASSMPSLRTGGQMLQGQMQLQGQQQQQQANNFAFNQQMMQQQQQQQGGIGQGMMSQTPMNMNNGNNNSGQLAMQASMFANAGVNSKNNNNNNNNNNAKKKNSISSIMGGMKGKDTPLFSFLRNRKRGSGNTNSNSMMSMTGKQQQQLAAAAAISPNNSALGGASNHSNNTSSSGILDAAPIDFSNSSSNPFLRKQMMNNLDQSVNRMNSARGRLGGRGLSSAMRRNMMQQMSTTTQLSKSCKELRRNRSSDSYESAGILVRVSSADHIPSRRTGLTAGAAKAQNRRFTLSRSNNSFGNLTKSKSGSRRELTKSGGGSSSRSLPGGGSSTRSLNSNDSQSSLIPIKRRGSMSGGRGGHGAKHKLGSGGGSARRISSVPYMGTSFGDSASAMQQRMDQQQHGPQHNDGWP
eukprot:CAMPEP_0116126856 /NCGR_PEP_ID=MMETSP0329-20121206/6544_1 /TAXON_ID=697910 /ORGANISM="Pseudo-nitzschia arenysensis, Strain B593" /LENGTH=844 /DNA_ID=CAMNT_0003620945 /DNA_START=569 /DNA_END=3103 /DNA_ORIENTATION=-